jgi:hypothetical protein
MRNVLYAFAILMFVLLMAIVAVTVQSGAEWMHERLVWGPLAISMSILLGSTIVGTAALIIAKSAETTMCRFLTGFAALLSMWCMQAYWEMPIVTCPISTVLSLVWFGWISWEYRNTKDTGFNKSLSLFFLAGLPLFLFANLFDYANFQKAVIVQMENYTTSETVAIVVVFSSMCVLLLEFLERKMANPDAPKL